MTKILNGSDIADFIKERQARQVRSMRQSSNIMPKLAIIKTVGSSNVIDMYVRMKERYASDILIDTIVETVQDDDMPAIIKTMNDDPSIHGIIVQLPLTETSKTDSIVNMISPKKDVDGLGEKANFDSATAEAINWLLVGYSIDIKNKKIVIIGNGRLVGLPLARIWRSGDYDVTVLEFGDDLKLGLRDAQIIITATGVANLLTSEMIPIGAVIVDAGTTSEQGVVTGDVDKSVRERDDIVITPEKGGVGPLTISALFEHLIISANSAKI